MALTRPSFPLPPRRRGPVDVKTIHGKLVLILAAPTCLLLLIAGIAVVAQDRSYSRANETRDGVHLVVVTEGLIHELQRERGLTNGFLGGHRDYRAAVDGQRLRVNSARASLDALLARLSGRGALAVTSALGRLSDLTSVRGEVDAGQADRADTLEYYTNAVTELGSAEFVGQENQRDTQLRRDLDALRLLDDAKEAAALERGFLNGVFSARTFRVGEYAQFTQIRATKLVALERFDALATPTQTAALDTATRSPASVRAAGMEQRAVAGFASRNLGVDSEAWWTDMTTLVDDLRGVQLSLGTQIERRAAQQRSGALRLLGGLVGLAVLALIGVAVLVLVTSRSITRPLRMLTAEANDIAEHRLPAAVAEVQGSDDPAVGLDSLPLPTSALASRQDEIAEVAVALDNVQRTAVRLAVEQTVLRRNTAESLANLGRRNQNLVRRQLGFISRLERDEADPNELANLFELDHLATRMRRNAESLLVLVGEQSPRKWSNPVGVGDVLRAALAEVEDYRRVVLRRFDDALVMGGMVAELAHLLAELLENALSFSPPDQDVEIHARMSDSRYHIAIVDHGLGMSADEIARANARLRGEERFLVAPTRFLGHYVVGQLAERLEAKVWLHESPLSGLTARVVLPAKLLVVPDATRPGTRKRASVSPVPAAAPEPAAALAGPASTRPRVRAEPDHEPRPAPPEQPKPRGPFTPLSSTREPAAGPPAETIRRTTPETTPQMTENGLIKRVPRGRAAENGGAVRNGSTRSVRADAAAPERTPEEVRAMLAGFRAGITRGHSGPARPDVRGERATEGRDAT